MNPDTLQNMRKKAFFKAFLANLGIMLLLLSIAGGAVFYYRGAIFDFFAAG